MFVYFINNGTRRSHWFIWVKSSTPPAAFLFIPCFDTLSQQNGADCQGQTANLYYPTCQTNCVNHQTQKEGWPYANHNGYMDNDHEFNCDGYIDQYIEKQKYGAGRKAVAIWPARFFIWPAYPWKKIRPWTQVVKAWQRHPKPSQPWQLNYPAGVGFRVPFSVLSSII